MIPTPRVIFLKMTSYALSIVINRVIFRKMTLRATALARRILATRGVHHLSQRASMPNTTNSATWDFNPTDPVHLSATFGFDTEDTQDAAPVAAATAAIQARLASATLTVVQTDPATITVTVTI